MNYRILSPALDELTAAVYFYQGKRDGLGLKFLDEFDLTVERILKYPLVWKATGKHHRRCRMERFSFAVLYALRSGEILISGIFAMGEDPNKSIMRVKRVG